MSIDYFLPTRSIFGEGSVNETGALLKSFNVGRALIVTDAFLAKSGATKQVKKLLKMHVFLLQFLVVQSLILHMRM